jgi:hypothetical protein
MTDELIASIEWRIADDVVCVRLITAQEIGTATEVSISTVDKIGSVGGVASSARGLWDAPKAASRITNCSNEFLDRE